MQWTLTLSPMRGVHKQLRLTMFARCWTVDNKDACCCCNHPDEIPKSELCVYVCLYKYQFKPVLPDIARETSKQAGLWKQAQNKQKKNLKEIITLCTHTGITMNPEMYCIVSLYLLLFLYVMILFCFSSRNSKQYDMQYNRKRNTLTTSPKTCNPRLPIYIYIYIYIWERERERERW